MGRATCGDAAGARVFQGSAREAHEQRVGSVGTGTELRMELGADHPGVIPQLADLHQGAVGQGAAGDEARLLQPGPKLVVQLVAVAVPLDDFLATVSGVGLGARHQSATVTAQPHGAALVLYAPLLR